MRIIISAMAITPTETIRTDRKELRASGPRTVLRPGFCAEPARRRGDHRLQPRALGQAEAAAGAVRHLRYAGWIVPRGIRPEVPTVTCIIMHPLLAHATHRGECSARARLLLADLRDRGVGTAHASQERRGFDDMHQVRPRLCEMVTAGLACTDGHGKRTGLRRSLKTKPAAADVRRVAGWRAFLQRPLGMAVIEQGEPSRPAPERFERAEAPTDIGVIQGEFMKHKGA